MISLICGIKKNKLEKKRDRVQKLAEGGTLPISFYETTINLIPKSDKDITKRKTTGQCH